MEVCLNLFLISLISVIIVGVSGFIGEIEDILAKWLKVKSVRIPKPFSCELCTSHWAGLIYLILAGKFTLAYYALNLMLAVLTPITEDIVWRLRDTLGVWVNFIYLTITGYKNK